MTKGNFVLLTIIVLLCLCSFPAGVLSLSAGINELYYYDGQRYFLYVPASVLANPEDAHILASIHGFSGRKDDSEGIEIVRKSATRWSELADENNWVVLSPHFDEVRFNDDYQRLNFSLIGFRADLRLNELIGEVARQIPGINSQKIYLFGFSGGGQFVHRYAIFYPERVLRAVAGGAGWYVWPDEQLIYPIGLYVLEFVYWITPDLNRFLSSDVLVLVGAEDTTKEDVREEYLTYNLTDLQGENRKIRAKNWVQELEQIATKEGVDFDVKLMFAPNTGHSISPELKTIAAEYLADTMEFSTGDLNKDGIVNILDVILVGQSLKKGMSASADPNPDINGDGTVSILDLILVCSRLTD